MTTNPDIALSYDDISIGVATDPSPVDSREDVDVSQPLFHLEDRTIELENPIIASNMDTVVNVEMAEAISTAGGVAVLPRHTDSNRTTEELTEEVCDDLEEIEGFVGASVGIPESISDGIHRVQKYSSAGADFICVDVPHANMDVVYEFVSQIDSKCDIPILVGNIDSGEVAKRLANAGADSVKVGIGPGSACTTRQETGVGTPQHTAVSDVVDSLETANLQKNDNSSNVTVVADGGLQTSGDISKALIASGANAVMTGRLLVGCKESPAEIVSQDGEEYKIYRGMASQEFREENDVDDRDPKRFVEGGSGFVEFENIQVDEKVDLLFDGVRSACSFCSAFNLDDARENARVFRTTSETSIRNGIHM